MSHPVPENPYLVKAADQPGADVAPLQSLKPLIEAPLTPAKVMAHHPFYQPAAVHPQRYWADLINSQQMAEFAEVNVGRKPWMQVSKSPQETQQLNPQLTVIHQRHHITITGAATQFKVDPVSQ